MSGEVSKNIAPVPVEMPLEADMGPAMLKLTDKQRRFVLAMIELGGKNYTRAAISAGYAYGGKDNTNGAETRGHLLAHDPKIQDAIRETGLKMMNAGSLLAVKTVLDIMDNPGTENKDRLKAAEMIMNRSGLHATTEHKVAVTHKSESTNDMVKRIELMARKLGLDPQKLLGNCVTDATYTEVAPDEDDLSDVL